MAAIDRQARVIPGVYTVQTTSHQTLDGQQRHTEAALDDHARRSDSLVNGHPRQRETALNGHLRHREVSPRVSLDSYPYQTAVRRDSSLVALASPVDLEVKAFFEAKSSTNVVPTSDERSHQVHPSRNSNGVGPGSSWSADLTDGPKKENPDGVLSKALRNIFVPHVAISVICGIVPIRLSTGHISVHPWRSTVLYVVAVQVLVGVSAHVVVTSYQDLLSTDAANAAGVDSRLLAAQSVLHVSSHGILLLAWLEMHRLHTLCCNAKKFLAQHAYMFGRKHPVPFRRLTKAVPWFTVFLSFVVSPVMVSMWCFYVLPTEDSVAHVLSHLFQVVFVNNIISLFILCCLILRDLAVDLSSKLREELSSGLMVAPRLEEFRLAWLGLRVMVTSLGMMPLSCLALLAYLLTMITLSAYQIAVSWHYSYSALFISSLSMFCMCQMGLVSVCDSAHRLSDEMTKSFCDPLEARSWRGFPPDLLAEHQQFVHTITCSPPEVSFAGMVTMKRSTYLSMMAAIMTYLIVLFQLRKSDEDEKPNSPNATDTIQSLLSKH